MKIAHTRKSTPVADCSAPPVRPQRHATTRRDRVLDDQRHARPRSSHRTVRRRSRQNPGIKRSAQKGAILVVVGALITTFALPAFASPPEDPADPRTLQQVAAGDSQSLVVASDVLPSPLQRGTFSATTPDEIAKRKAAEAAAARATANAQVTSARFDFSMVSPGSGLVRWPLGGPFTVGDRFGARGGAHMGTDMLSEGGTPVFAALDGVVRISQDSYSAYGVAIVLESVVNGRRVSTVYPHMRSGSRQVGVGQTVSAGQLIGLVGSTGRSTANHLHFEVYIDGQAVDSLSWLEANAG